MCLQKVLRAFILFSAAAFFCGCDTPEVLKNALGAYRVSARIDGAPLSEISFAGSGDEIQPFFERPVGDDPDVTALLVYMRNPVGDIVGRKFLYSIDGNFEPDETLFYIKSLDDPLPPFIIPDGLPFGRNTVVSHVMAGRYFVQRIEKTIFNLGGALFSYDRVKSYLPGITDNPNMVPRASYIMLEAKVDFDEELDPYVVWYHNRKKISEGRYNDGAGFLLWKTPEMNGFFTIRADVFPVADREGLAGYQKEVSLLVSSRTLNLNLVSEDIEQLAHWYVFAGSLDDSKAAASEQAALKPVSGNKPQWQPANGTYGLAAGYNNAFALPDILIPGGELEQGGEWQFLFRFRPVNDGVILSVSSESAPGVYMDLSVDGQDLVLTLASPAKTVSQSCTMPAKDAFITAGVSVAVNSGSLSAKINVMGISEQGELAAAPVSLEAAIKDKFQVFLGMKREDADNLNVPVTTAIWDEFAVYNAPSTEIISAVLRLAVRHGLGYGSSN
ncbi:MAG: hypothetical protein LBQ89_03095 [Treponema sp.]|jgi:hypothetical protein|nr:hypothetical protein [Treponema sp.]